MQLAVLDESPSMASLKPKLSVPELIIHLKKNGVKFLWMSEKEATEFLESHNNYFKLTAYRKNFQKQKRRGLEEEQYIDLDFGHLRALSTIDMRLRYILMHMCADVEHAIKVQLIKMITDDPDEDGYSIVTEYRAQLSTADDNNQKMILQKELEKVASAPYTKDIMNKYKDELPIWAFTEVVPFGRMIDIYRFYNRKKQLTENMKIYYILWNVRQLRNAVAHNSCIINDLGKEESNMPINKAHMNAKDTLAKEIAKLTISKPQRKKHMKNTRMLQIISLLYAHKSIVQSLNQRNHRYAELLDLVHHEMAGLGEHFASNTMLISCYNFFKIVVDNWCKV